MILLFTTVVYAHTIVSVIGLNTKNTSNTNTITCNNNTTITNNNHGNSNNNTSNTTTSSSCTNTGGSNSYSYHTNMGVMVQYLPKKPKYVVGGGIMQNQDFFLTLGIVLK